MAVAGSHRYEVRVYYEDTDAGGVAYHASYLRFAERARTEAMRALGVAHSRLVAEFNLMFVVRRINLDYLRPARLDDRLTIVTWPESLGRASVLLRQVFEAEQGGAWARLAVLDVQLACVRGTDGRPARIPDAWHAAFAGLVRAGPGCA